MKNSEFAETKKIAFGEIFDIQEIQNLQDLFSDATGVASIITDPDGNPITQPSNFCKLCNDIIRKTAKGMANCFKSDAILGQNNTAGAKMQPCLSGGLWDAGASISVGGNHIANWLIGQVRNSDLDEIQMLNYADEIGANREEFMDALNQVPQMSIEQFNKVSKMLFAFANELSEKAYSNYQLKNEIIEKENAKELLKESEELFKTVIYNSADLIILTDEKGIITLVSHQCQRIIGYSPDKFLGKLMPDIIHPDDREKCEKAWSNLFKNEQELKEFEYKIIDEKGCIRIISHSAKLVKTEGRILGMQNTIRDITEKKQNEETLLQSEDNYKRSMDESLLGLRIVTKDGKTLYLNKALLDIYGFGNIKEYIEAPIEQRYTVNGIIQHKIRKEKRISGEIIPSEYEIDIIRKDGEIRHVSVMRKEIIWNKSKQFQVIYQDITDRKKTEKALKESNELLTSFILNSPIYAYIKEVTPNQSLVLKASENFVDMLGIPGSKMTGKNMYELFPENFAKNITEDDWAVVSNNKIIKIDEELNGRFYNTIKFPIKQGTKNLLAGYTIDVTERKQAENKINRNKILLEKTFEQSPIPMVLVSMPDAIIRIANSASLRFLGFKDDQSPVNMPLKDLNPTWQDFNLLGKSVNINELPLARSLTGIKTIAEERRIVLDDGTIRYGLVYASPILDINGNIIAGYMVMLDITDRKLMELQLHEKTEEYLQINEELVQTGQELNNAKEKAEESDRLKTAFLQNMSHEIRTPMNAINGFSALLEKPELSVEKRKSFIKIIQNSGHQLLSIVNDILTISSLETKQEILNIKPVYVNNVMLDLLTIFKTQATNQNISLYAKQQLNNCQSEIYADKTKLTQILSNLITNALKFTHEGFIEFGYEIVETQGIVSLQFYVKDSGIGIKQDLLDKIFERFRQADLTIIKKYGGTGLGLSISKGFVELMGGKIWVESEIDKGSTFYFTIPYNPVNKLNNENFSLKQSINITTILVAEDEEFNYLLIEELLIKKDIQLIHAKDGVETVKICRENNNIDLILMDIKMPIMDGHAAAKLIKEFRPNLPIIAQTAYALDFEIAKFKDNVFDEYIVKPINEEELKLKVFKYLKNKTNK